MKKLKPVVVLLVLVIMMSGCRSRFPGEVVELSTTVGQDIKALHQSYRALVITHFKALRAQVESFIKNQWTPQFVQDFMHRGNLAQMARDGENQQVKEWVSVALETIMEKKNKLMKPIDRDEKKLLELVDHSFAMLSRANDKISEHLKRKAKEAKMMEQALNISDLKGLRRQITEGLAEASKKAGINIGQENNGEPVSKGELD